MDIKDRVKIFLAMPRKGEAAVEPQKKGVVAVEPPKKEPAVPSGERGWDDWRYDDV